MDMTMESCRKFVEVLASDAPAPGGGGAAALVGAIGTALGNMVGSLTVGKKKYADVQDEIILTALRSLGLSAERNGRNDMTLDGKKFSGNAVCIHNNRVLQHGTLLFKSSVSSLSAALNTRPEKFIGKSVQSNVSRVTNISEHLPANAQMDIEQFIEYLKEYIFSNLSEGFTIGEYTPEDFISQLRKCFRKNAPRR